MIVNMVSLSYPPNVSANGIWSQQVRPIDGAMRPALFLDRDGVILEEVHYLRKVEDVRLIREAAAIIRASNNQRILVVVVTNQSGIGRGMYTWEDFKLVQNTMLAALADEEAYIDAVYACPFHGVANFPWNVRNHPDRKPEPGMLLRAASKLPISMSHSWIIGDRADDIKAGKNARLAGGFHVLSGHGNDDGERSAALAHGNDMFCVLTGDNIGSALNTLPILC